MSIETPADLAALRRVGHITRLALDALERNVRAGVTTAQLDAVAAALFARHGARSAPAMVYGFPGHVLISINDEIVHGMPGSGARTRRPRQARRDGREGWLHRRCRAERDCRPATDHVPGARRCAHALPFSARAWRGPGFASTRLAGRCRRGSPQGFAVVPRSVGTWGRAHDS